MAENVPNNTMLTSQMWGNKFVMVNVDFCMFVIDDYM